MKDNFFKNKKILLFSPYGATKHYGECISKELRKRGAYVIEYDERPSQKTFSKIIIRLFKKRFPCLFLQYIKKIIKEQRSKDFDYVLVLRGEAFSSKAVVYLKKAFPNAFFILYLWDILQTTQLKDVICSFDRALTFDPTDAASHPQLNFRPTFYIDHYTDIASNDNPQNDVLFIGTLHSNRYEVLKRIEKILVYNDISYYFYMFLPSRVIYFSGKLLRKNLAKRKDIHFKPISLDDTIQQVRKSKSILDLRYPNQTSLSMRAFEALAAHRKYITTNPEITKYDFYTPQNILVISEDDPIIPPSFINSPFEEISIIITQKYSVGQFINDVFDCDNCR